ncbi:MAG: transglycosylase SLT domain-containing protein [Thermodesulfovibrionales bacterium]
MKNHKKNTFRVFCLRTFLFICVSFFLLPSPGESDTDCKEHFRQGRKNLEALSYSEAVSNLSLAQREFPLLEDYTLYYLAEAYHGMGDHQKSLEAIHSLLEKYPATPLRKKVRIAEIREAKEISSDVVKLYEAYIRDYQEDEAALFLYGKALLEAGNTAKASAVFKKIYIGAGEFSSTAHSELKAEDLTSKDIIERAANQFRRYDFAEAEQDLRQALSKDDGSCSTEILKNLGYSLFRQKKYVEAAEVFGRVDDYYYRSRSLYRAGDKKGFDTSLETLIKSKDPQAGYLLNAVAADKRREKDFEGAIKIYNDVLNNYPSDVEEALWGIGWTQYISGDFAKSAVTFSQLYGKYDDLKYLYWEAKSLEADGKNASEFYRKLMQADNSFYAFMAYTTNKTPLGKSVSLNPSMIDSSREKIKKSERVEAMISLDMQKEAVIELSFASRKIDTPEELVYIITKLQELGEYKRAIGLASQIPYSEKMHKFWYPLAYWDSVEPIAKKYNIDPLVALSVMREESRFDANAKSVAGAYGLMQLMPQTAYRLDRSLKLGINSPSQLTVIGNNIQLGSFYLKTLFNDFHSLPHVLAAYNAGEQAVKIWQARGNYRSVDEFIEDIPYAETRNYVKKVLTSYFQYKKLFSVDRDEVVLDIILGEL